ncbi:AAA family ATPase [Romboutsia weinsteinii]|uniref:AAA family ATPase n=1 Tax=Romboutsia weinsteinii TaxID=2020949 RepID=A0A371J411_9FIRM|nr:ATP-binding protein [Romboutsia weinsteinii]RDY27406.1 AAA family ATPase [Romboutsia weinsteinii]
MELNLSPQFKERINQFIQSQSKNSSDENKSYLSHRYKCSKCKDLTFIIEGKEVIPCKCKEEKDTENIYASSGISGELVNKSFDNFNYAYDLQIMDAFNTAKNYAKYFNSIKNTKNNSIIFMGSEGCGKTHLSLAIANNLINRGIYVVYMSCVDDMKILKRSIKKREDYINAIDRYKEAQVLILDDLFRFNVSDIELEIISDIINYRYINSKPMIINSEKSMKDICDIDESVGNIISQICKKRNVEIKVNRLGSKVYG